MNILAYPIEQNLFKLVDNKKGSVYQIKEALKAEGAKWDGKNWIVTEYILTKLNIPRMYLADIDQSCHMPKQKIYVSSFDYNQGFTYQKCSLCDSNENERVRIIKIK